MYIATGVWFLYKCYIHRSGPVDVNCLAPMQGFSADFIVSETVEFARMDGLCRYFCKHTSKPV